MTSRRAFLRSATLGATLPLVARTPSRVQAAIPGETPRWSTAVGLNGFLSGTHKYGKTYPIWEVLDFASRTGHALRPRKRRLRRLPEGAAGPRRIAARQLGQLTA